MPVVSPEHEGFYSQMATQRGDSSELRACVDDVVGRLLEQATSAQRPGVLLGKIQSGKTRAFLGVIASAFDRGFDCAVVLTKGTKSLVKQTLARIGADFRAFSDRDELQAYDIMALPGLTGYELAQKLIFVVKKEDDNLRKLESLVKNYEVLRQKNFLIVDDEADLASVTFRVQGGQAVPGVIASQIDAIQKMVTGASVLQVTATPYALYLQADEDIPHPGGLLRPKRPAFTVLLPPFNGYVGADQYFQPAPDREDPAYYFFHEIPALERDALKKSDGRRLKLEDVLVSPNAEVIRLALMSFMVGAAARRLQDGDLNRKKYAFLFHTEQRRSSHDWQEKVVRRILSELQTARPDVFDAQFGPAWDDIEESIGRSGSHIPTRAAVHDQVRGALERDFINISCVNSDQDVEAMLDDEGQLRLRTPFNIFIGGQILDRGITISNLIAFYYGRNPQQLQQDTVSQHCRMYGARTRQDLFVTRFYAPLGVYAAMRRMHEFDTALWQAIERGANEAGVYFLQRDAATRVVPCSPSKLAASRLVTVGPGSAMRIFGFQTVAKTQGRTQLAVLDGIVEGLLPKDGEGVLLELYQALELLKKCHELLEFQKDEGDDDRRAQGALLEHLAISGATDRRVWATAYRNRQLARRRPSGRFSDAPESKIERQRARDQMADGRPALAFFREEGAVADGWSGMAFWWPVLFVPPAATPVVFAGDAPI